MTSPKPASILAFGGALLMRAFVLSAALTGLSGIGLMACNPNSIGRPCINPAGTGATGSSSQIESPALECPSRLCLLTANIQASNAGDGGSGIGGVCTARCDTNDDCQAETTAYCSAGFVCAVAASTGPFKCDKICICKTDLDPTFNSPPQVDGGVVPPCACPHGANANPTCPEASK